MNINLKTETFITTQRKPVKTTNAMSVHFGASPPWRRCILIWDGLYTITFVAVQIFATRFQPLRIPMPIAIGVWAKSY